jgi:hypothetical protein
MSGEGNLQAGKAQFNSAINRLAIVIHVCKLEFSLLENFCKFHRRKSTAKLFYITNTCVYMCVHIQEYVQDI